MAVFALVLRLHIAAGMSLTIAQRRTGTVEVLRLAGRLTLGEGSSTLRNAIRDTCERGVDVLVDLSDVSYIDSAGLGELVAGFATIASQGHEMKLLKPNKRVDSMLQITKLYTTFEVFDDEAAGLASFGIEK
jgi:anti-sigma B factor antagonist